MLRSARIQMEEAFQKFKDNLNITDEFMALPHDGEWARTFREVCGLSLQEMGFLTGYTKSGVNTVETRKNSERYFKCLEKLWESRNLERLSDSFQAERRIPRGKKIKVDKIVGLTPEWRRCPACDQVKYFTSRKQVYCSKKCSIMARKTGLRVRGNATPKRPKAFICPNCGAYIPDYRRHLVRQSTDTSFAETATDEIRHLETAPSRSEVSYILRRLEKFLQPQRTAKIPPSSQDGTDGDVFHKTLRAFWDTAQEQT